MDILIDGENRTVETLPKTMGELIGDLKDAAGRTDRVVLSVSVDGSEMDMTAQEGIAGRPVDDFSSVELGTADSKLLCSATIDEASRHISPIIDEAGRIAALLDEGKDDDARLRIVPCLGVLSMIIAAVEKVSILLSLDLSGISNNGVSMGDVIAELASFLQALKIAIDSGDFVAVRDAMKHELPEIAQKLEEQLAGLSRTVLL